MTAKRVTYRVDPDGDRWKVVRQGTKGTLAEFDNKADAVRRGRELAKQHEKGQLIIKKQNGRIQTEYTYGSDPTRSRG